MNTFVLLFGLSICMVGVYARHIEDHISDSASLSPDQNDGIRKHGSESRHRRRRWQMNYGYDYSLPPTHSYYPERREYDNRNQQQDLLPQIVKLLEEIATYVKRPAAPAAPQPVYIPYPVPYLVPQYGSCSDNATKKPSIHTRFPEMEDTNQNWGFVTNKDDDTDDLSDAGRPISFEPLKPLRPMKRPSPKVEHGSSQADSKQPSTPAPQFNDQPGSLRTPSMCNAAILSCCADDKAQQRVCFNGFGCGVSYDNGNACSDESISAALESFKSAYSPVQ
ncbi:hypothetical protein SFRURICE_014388 [Spodoptera frugiperda]|uniref:SFRICE_037336 n=1 Tax=Spodoptera frugiperda TaxID=7108 RepID=A0A2H1WX31_SPOFR|nr:hypothetical protein SFRURICE_014388 [Spodoptera frugiperda]